MKTPLKIMLLSLSIMIGLLVLSKFVPTDEPIKPETEITTPVILEDDA